MSDAPSSQFLPLCYDSAPDEIVAVACPIAPLSGRPACPGPQGQAGQGEQGEQGRSQKAAEGRARQEGEGGGAQGQGQAGAGDGAIHEGAAAGRGMGGPWALASVTPGKQIMLNGVLYGSQGQRHLARVGFTMG